MVLLEDLSDRVHYKGLQNGLEDHLICLHGYKMATGFVTSIEVLAVSQGICKEMRMNKKSEVLDREI